MVKKGDVVFVEPLEIQVCLNYQYKGEGEYATLLYDTGVRKKVKFLKPLNINGYEYDEVLIRNEINKLTQDKIQWIFNNQKKFFKITKEG